MAQPLIRHTRFVSSEPDQTIRRLPPIAGYEKEPLVPLRVACQPLKSILNNELDKYINQALEHCKKPKDELTPDESAAIYLFTTEWTVRENSLYHVLNATLRDEHREKLRPWYLYLKLFLTAFYKLPLCKHEVIWRGVNLDLRNEYPKNKKFTWWTITSCTAAINILNAPQYLDRSKSRTLFSIVTRAGRLIQNHSAFADEEEVLLPPGHAFNVVGGLMHADDAFVIHLTDSKPPFITLVKPFPSKHERLHSANEKELQIMGHIGMIAEKLRQKVAQNRDRSPKSPYSPRHIPSPNVYDFVVQGIRYNT